MLLKFNGNMAKVAKAHGVTRQAVQHYVHEHAELQQVRQDAIETMLDVGEDALHVSVRKQRPWAVCFFLKCKGKARGYVERQELTGADGAPIQAVEVIVRTRAEAEAVLKAAGGP